MLVLWSGRGALDSWYEQVGGPLAIWRAWAENVRGSALDAGHFFPEETPHESADALERFSSDPWSPALILILAGLGFIGFGLAYALRPDRMAALTDLTLTSPTARADFVATYGGFQIGFGAFLLVCAGKASWVEPGLWAFVTALAGFASLRALAILLHRGRVRRSIWFGLALELFGLGLGAWGLARLDQ